MFLDNLEPIPFDNVERMIRTRFFFYFPLMQFINVYLFQTDAHAKFVLLCILRLPQTLLVMQYLNFVVLPNCTRSCIVYILFFVKLLAIYRKYRQRLPDIQTMYLGI